VVHQLGIPGEAVETESLEAAHLGEEREDHLVGGMAFLAKGDPLEMVASACLGLPVEESFLGRQPFQKVVVERLQGKEKAGES